MLGTGWFCEYLEDLESDDLSACIHLLYSVADEIFPPRYQLSLQALLVKAVRILGVLGSAVSFPLADGVTT